MKYLKLFVFLIWCNFISAQDSYYQGFIELNDGSTIEALTEIPSSPFDKKITYIDPVTLKEINLKSNLISSLYVIVNDSFLHKFEYGTIKVFDKLTNTFKLKKKKKWLCLSYETEEMNVSSCGHEYYIEPDGKLIVNTSLFIEYFVRKTSEEEFILAYRYDGIGKKNKYFINCLSVYCKDIPILARKIFNGQYKWDRIYEIAEAYSYYKLKK